MSRLQPYILRDIRGGRYIKYSVNSFLIPDNSVSHSVNINYDTIVGSGVVRNGTTLLGTTSAARINPLGLSEFAQTGSTIGLLLAVYSATTNGQLYYYDTSWHTAATTAGALSNTKYNRFSTLGGRSFFTNSTNGMRDSVDGSTWVTTNSIDATVLPSMVFRYAARLLAAGDTTYPSRVWFSSIIAPGSSPIITWNTNVSTGDWIDINPDDGGYVSGFSETSTFVLVFKNTGMYRMDSVSKNVNPENIYNIGAVSQEAITLCQGVTYFFSGQDIRRTNGGYPEQISRAGVQDIIDAIPQSSWSTVASGTDGFNVYFSVGNVTLNTNKNDQVTINNCVLKFSTRDQNWSVHSYANLPKFFAQLTTSANGRILVESDTAGNAQQVNIGTTDNGNVINYTLETQELEFGNRSHLKKISDKIVLFTNNGIDSALEVRQDDGDYKPLMINASNRVNIASDVNLEGHYLTFRWYGESKGTAPVFEGIYVENIEDQGIL